MNGAVAVVEVEVQQLFSSSSSRPLIFISACSSLTPHFLRQETYFLKLVPGLEEISGSGNYRRIHIAHTDGKLVTYRTTLYNSNYPNLITTINLVDITC